jgi:hypothetical protein
MSDAFVIHNFSLEKARILYHKIESETKIGFC